MKQFIFAEIMVGEEFRYNSQLYHKVSYEAAIPIDFSGDDVLFMWNTVVTPERTA